MDEDNSWNLESILVEFGNENDKPNDVKDETYSDNNSEPSESKSGDGQDGAFDMDGVDVEIDDEPSGEFYFNEEDMSETYYPFEVGKKDYSKEYYDFTRGKGHLIGKQANKGTHVRYRDREIRASVGKHTKEYVERIRNDEQYGVNKKQKWKRVCRNPIDSIRKKNYRPYRGNGKRSIRKVIGIITISLLVLTNASANSYSQSTREIRNAEIPVQKIEASISEENRADIGDDIIIEIIFAVPG